MLLLTIRRVANKACLSLGWRNPGAWSEVTASPIEIAPTDRNMWIETVDTGEENYDKENISTSTKQLIYKI